MILFLKIIFSDLDFEFDNSFTSDDGVWFDDIGRWCKLDKDGPSGYLYTDTTWNEDAIGKTLDSYKIHLLTHAVLMAAV